MRSLMNESLHFDLLLLLSSTPILIELGMINFVIIAIVGMTRQLLTIWFISIILMVY